MAEQLRTLVHRALDNACTNGHEDECCHCDPKRVAADLICYDAEIEILHLDISDLLPHIQTWRDRRAN